METLCLKSFCFACRSA